MIGLPHIFPAHYDFPPYLTNSERLVDVAAECGEEGTGAEKSHMNRIRPFFRPQLLSCGWLLIQNYDCKKMVLGCVYQSYFRLQFR